MLRFQKNEETRAETTSAHVSVIEEHIGTQKSDASPAYTQEITDKAEELYTTSLAQNAESRKKTRNQKRAENSVQNAPVLFGMRWTRPRKRALVVFGIASAIGIRWIAANAPSINSFPTRTEPHNIAPKQLNKPNAEHFYASALDTLDLENPGIKDFSPENATLAEKIAAVNQATEALDWAHQGVTYPFYPGKTNYYKFSVQSFTLDSPTPNFVGVRTLARLMTAESSVLASRGQYQAATNAALDTVRYGQDMGQGSGLIDGMIGVLVEKLGLNEARTQVSDLSAQEARTLATRLEGIAASERNFGQLMEAERRTLTNSVQKMFESRNSVPGLPEVLGLDGQWENAQMSAAFTASVFWYGKQGMLDALNAHLDESVRRGMLPYQEARALQKTALPELPLVLQSFIPNTVKAHKTHTQAVALQRLLLLELALHAYRLEHGNQLPMTLDELTAGENPYLRTLPADPFSFDGKQPMRYKNGRVYSAGENGQDDGNTGDDLLDQPAPTKR